LIVKKDFIIIVTHIKDIHMKRSSQIIALFFLFCTLTINGQNGPVTIAGQHYYTLNNSYSLPQAKLECKAIAARNGITAYLLIHQPEAIIGVEEVNCIYENLSVIDVIEEQIAGNELFMKILTTTDTQTINSCTN